MTTKTAIMMSGMAPAPAAPKAATNSDQCWDMATNSVKNSQAKTAQQGANTSPGATSPSTNPTTPPGAAAGGILGRIVEVGDQFLTLEIADNVRIKVQRFQVTSLVPKGTIKGS